MSKTSSSKEKKRGIKTWEKIAAGILVLAFIIYIVFLNIPVENKEGKKVSEDYVFKKEGELVISDSTGNESKVKIDIEIAKSDYDRQLGLMFRTDMTEMEGMLFIFPEQKFQAFWMLNTNISLDMIFINEEKKIVTIHKSTTPLSEQSYPSTAPAKYVLEVLAGFTDKYNVKTGDKVHWTGIQQTEL